MGDIEMDCRVKSYSEITGKEKGCPFSVLSTKISPQPKWVLGCGKKVGIVETKHALSVPLGRLMQRMIKIKPLYQKATNGITMLDIDILFLVFIWRSEILCHPAIA